MAAVVTDYYFYKGLIPVAEADVRTLLTIARKSATEQSLSPHKVLVRPLIHESQNVSNEEQADTKTWRLDLCYKDAAQTQSTTHEAYSASLDENRLFREVVHKGTEEDGKTRFGGRCVWPSREELVKVPEKIARSFQIAPARSGRQHAAPPTAGRGQYTPSKSGPPQASSQAGRRAAPAQPHNPVPPPASASTPAPTKSSLPSQNASAVPNKGASGRAASQVPAKNAADHSAVPPSTKLATPATTAATAGKANTKPAKPAKSGFFGKSSKK